MPTPATHGVCRGRHTTHPPRRSTPAARRHPSSLRLAFAEFSFFPIPPDVLLMALSLGRPARALWFATIATGASVLGGVLRYFIGMGLPEQISRPILER